MKAQWLGAGLEALRKGGVSEVRVERLAAALGITKGSFYWHFRDRGELLEAVLEHWAREMTDAEFERIADDPVTDSSPVFVGKERWQIWERRVASSR